MSTPSATPEKPAPAPKHADAIRTAVCGLGRIGWPTVEGALTEHPGFTFVAGMDNLPERLELLTRFADARGYTDYQELLADPAVELVILATRSADHKAMTLQALEAGKTVLVEKPVTLNLADTEELLAAAQHAPGKLLVKHNRRYDAPLVCAKKALAEGKLGRVVRLQLRCGGYNRRTDWQTLKKFGGGQLLNWGPHVVDWALQIVGAPARDLWADVRRISAAGDAEDYFKIVFRGPDGAVADIEIGGSTLPQNTWHLIGEHGTLAGDDKQARLKYCDPSTFAPLTADSGTPVMGQGYGSLDTITWTEETVDLTGDDLAFWERVYRTVRHGEPFPITADDVRETMRILDLTKQGTPFA